MRPAGLPPDPAFGGVLTSNKAAPFPEARSFSVGQSFSLFDGTSVLPFSECAPSFSHHEIEGAVGVVRRILCKPKTIRCIRSMLIAGRHGNPEFPQPFKTRPGPVGSLLITGASQRRGLQQRVPYVRAFRTRTYGGTHAGGRTIPAIRQGLPASGCHCQREGQGRAVENCGSLGATSEVGRKGESPEAGRPARWRRGYAVRVTRRDRVTAASPCPEWTSRSSLGPSRP
jgi:hypothetical protein